mgnify:CR=1 FL=1
MISSKSALLEHFLAILGEFIIKMRYFMENTSYFLIFFYKFAEYSLYYFYFVESIFWILFVNEGVTYYDNIQELTPLLNHVGMEISNAGLGSHLLFIRNNYLSCYYKQ